MKTELFPLIALLLAGCSTAGVTSSSQDPFHYTHVDGEFSTCLNSRNQHGYNTEGTWECRDLRGAKLVGQNFSGADLSGSLFDSANLERATFKGAKLHGASFSGALLEGADFSGAMFGREADFNRAILSRARFDGVSLLDATFYRARLDGARFSACTLVAVDFSHASLSDAEFRDCSWINQLDFYRAHLDRATFVNSDVNNLKFYDAILRQSSFKNLRSTFCGAKGRAVDCPTGFNFYSPEIVGALKGAEFDASSSEALKLNKAQLKALGATPGK